MLAREEWDETDVGTRGLRKDSEVYLEVDRLRLVKIGACQLLHMHLVSGHPGQRLWQALAEGVHE